ncbi:MAG: CpXC domain-containing protein [Finegoldia sp.]|nr:CpXC domain-containing protein [Finegoldia sp.]
MDKVDVKCPVCRHEGKFEVHSNVEANKDSDLKKKILTGELFTYICPVCNNRVNINYGMLYRDDEKKFMAKIAVDELEFEQARQTFGEIDKIENEQIRKVMAPLLDYDKRIVINWQNLAEKIMIKDAGLDDKVIELIKVLYVQAFYKQNPDKEVVAVHFAQNSGDNYIVFVAKDQNYTMPVTDNLYKKLEGQLSKMEKADDLVVDLRWADQTFKKLIEEDKKRN